MTIAKALILAVLFSAHVFAEDRCFVESEVQDYSMSDPRCFYFSGTAAYRDENYVEAFRNWELLLSMPVQEVFSELWINANNNLGYLKYHGLGSKERSVEALEHWRSAVSLGHKESQYHLCYALADPESVLYSPKEAKPYCMNAKLFYENIAAPNEDQRSILQTIRQYISE